MSTDPARPITSARPVGINGVYLGPNGREPGLTKWCDYRGCTAKAGSYIPCGVLNLSLREALFGYELTQCYPQWQASPEFYGLCGEHYRKVKRKDGYTLGYRMRQGKLRAFVKQEHF